MKNQTRYDPEKEAKGSHLMRALPPLTEAIHWREAATPGSAYEASRDNFPKEARRNLNACKAVGGECIIRLRARLTKPVAAQRSDDLHGAGPICLASCLHDASSTAGTGAPAGASKAVDPTRALRRRLTGVGRSPPLSITPTDDRTPGENGSQSRALPSCQTPAQRASFLLSGVP